MVPNPGQDVPVDRDTTVSKVENDGGTPPTFNEETLYRVVREAIKDALLDVIGTVLLVGIAFVLVVAGGQAALSSTSVLGAVAGAGLLTGGLYLAAATLELIPPIRHWL